MRVNNVLLVVLFVLALPFTSFAQEKEVSGTVKDQSGLGLMGVAVVVRGEQRGVETNENGHYSIKVAKGSVLVFSYIGMKTQEVRVGDSNRINITLKDEAIAIDETVVVGFGQKRAVKELTGSVGKVGQEIANNASASIDKALSGKVAGVQGGMASGQPGGAALLRIRGRASINGRNAPIYIVDGVRVAQGDLTSNTPTGNILASINENDIESVTILKDAVSTAIYGADAGAGVVIITTKSGKKGDAKFNLNAETGLTYRALEGEQSMRTKDWLPYLYDSYLNSSLNEKTKYANREALIAALEAGGGPNYLKGIYKNRNIDTDWRKETERSAALLQKFNGSVSGGTDKLTYFSSLGYYNQDGIVRSSSFIRVTNANRINYKATDKLTLATDLQFSYSKMNASSDGSKYTNPILSQYLLRPTDPAKNPDGTYYKGVKGRLSNNFYNTAAALDVDYIRANTARMFANFQADYKLLKNLTYKFVFAPEYITIEEDQYNNPDFGQGAVYKGLLESYATRVFNFNVQNSLSYDFTLKDKNHFSVLLAQEAYKTDKRVLGAEGKKVGSRNLQTLNSFVETARMIGTKKVTSRAGYALNLHYDFDKMILIDLSGRQDALSNFWEGNKVGYFWSAGAGLDFARLPYFSENELVSQLKVSASYGKVGNLTENAVPYTTYRYSGNYNNNIAAYPNGVDNKDLRWEVINPLNIGLDLGFWHDRLTIGVAYFHKKTKDMVFDIPLSTAQAGYTNKDGVIRASKYINIGEMTNSGIEVTIGGKIIKNSDDGFNWSANANLSTLDNKVTKLYEGKDIVGSYTLLREGEAAYTFYLPEWAGVDPATGAPQWYDKDGKVTSDYNKAEKKVLGSALATLYGGFDTKLSYHGITLEGQLSYGFGNKIYDQYGEFGYLDGKTAVYPGYRSQTDYWTPENPNARNPKPVYNRKDKAGAASSRFLYKGDYVRLRTLKLSYEIKPAFLENTYLKKVQLYVMGDNIWTHTFDKNFKYDPDMQVNGYASFALPPLKTYSLGVNVNF